MTTTARAARIAVLIGLTIAGSLAAQTPASCPPCAHYDNALAPMRATLAQFRAELAEAQATLEKERQYASGYTGMIFNQQVNPAAARRMEKMLAESIRAAEEQAERWRRAVESQEKAVRDLEAARDACVRDQCRPAAGGAAGSALATPAWGDFQVAGRYFVEDGCPDCDRLQDKLRDLEARRPALEAAIAEAERKVAAAEEVRDAVSKTNARLFHERGRPARTPEELAEVDRWMKDHEIAQKKVDQARWNRDRALDDLGNLQDDILATQMAIEDCQRQSCVPRDDEDADGPGFGMWIGVVGGFLSWDHPEEAARSTLDNVDFPGATKTATTDTEDTVPGIEIGIRWPLVEGDGFTLWADGSVTVYDEAEFSGTARTEVTTPGGTELLSVVQFDFMTGRVIVPQVDLRLATLGGFFVQGGASYFETPMDLRITDSFFVDGVADDEIVTEEEIDDSAIGFDAGLGWMGEHWELGVDYRRAKINDADLETISARIRVVF